MSTFYVDAIKGSDTPKIDRSAAGSTRGMKLDKATYTVTIADSDVDCTTDLQAGDYIIFKNRGLPYVNSMFPDQGVVSCVISSITDSDNVVVSLIGPSSWAFIRDITVEAPYIIFDKDRGTSSDPFANPYYPTLLCYNLSTIHIASGIYAPIMGFADSGPAFVPRSRHSTWRNSYIGWGKVIFDGGVGERNSRVISGIVLGKAVYNIEFRNIEGFAIEALDVQGCSIINCDYGISGGGNVTGTIKNNVFARIENYAVDRYRTSTEISNNTFYRVKGKCITGDGSYEMDEIVGLILRNNIFYQCKLPYTQQHTAPSLAAFTDFNLYYDCEDMSETFYVLGNGDVNAIVGLDPLFTDADNNDFTLEQNSPAAAPFGYQRKNIGAKGGGFVSNSSTNSTTWLLSTYGGGTTTPDPYIRDGGGGTGHAPDNGITEVVSGNGWVEEASGKWSVSSGNFVYDGAVGEDHYLLSPVYDLNTKGALTVGRMLQTIFHSDNAIAMLISEDPTMYRFEVRGQVDGFPQDPSDPLGSGEVPAWADVSGGSVPYEVDMSDELPEVRCFQVRITGTRGK